MKPRSTLKSYFTKGAIPKESDFADLIDSVLIQDEDTVFKSANDPLSIKATGAEEALLNFYRAEQGNNTLTWQLKQKPSGASKPGLSIGEGAGTSLFIESGSGNVGIGTSTPGARLEVSGATRLNGGLTVTGQTKLSATVGINREPVADQHLVITPTAGNIPLNVTNPDSTKNWLSVFSTGNVIMNGGNVGIGSANPGAKLDVTADSTTWNGWYEALRFSEAAHSAITHPGGGLLFGMHSDRSFYFLDGHRGQYVMRIKADSGNVGIGTTDPTTKLQVNGEVYAQGKVYCVGGIVIHGPQSKWRIHDGNGWAETSAPSDVRLKKDVQSLPHALQKVLSLRGVAYKWNDLGLQRLSRSAETYDAGPGATEQEQLQVRATKRQEAYEKLSGIEIGMIAQEVRQIAPELVSEDEDGYLGVAYERAVALLIEALKEQQAMIEALSDKIAAMPVA